MLEDAEQATAAAADKDADLVDGHHQSDTDSSATAGAGAGVDTESNSIRTELSKQRYAHTCKHTPFSSVSMYVLLQFVYKKEHLSTAIG